MNIKSKLNNIKPLTSKDSEIEIVKIPLELRDYIELLNYEEVRYKDLLNCVTKEYMTEEEYNDSYNYYSKLYKKAKLSRQFALETLVEIYQDKIKNKPWHINFYHQSLVIGTTKVLKTMDTYSDEQYSDQLNRLYPPQNPEPIHINGPHTKDITLQVTDACNMACTYCYQHSKGKNTMSFETAKQFLDMILDADERTNTYITSTESNGAVIGFIGGEPWLEIDLITKISQYFMNELFRRKHPWAIKFMFSVCSNGLMHFDPRVQKYLNFHKNHMSYSISIDGDKDLHDSCRIDLNGQGTYDRAIKAVRDYQANKEQQIGTKMTISPDNVDKIYNALTSMIGIEGYRHINLNCVYEEGWTNEHANILYWELHKIVDWLFENKLQNEVNLSIFSEIYGKPKPESDNQNWCGGLGLMIGVDYKGDIYPCIRYMETSCKKGVEPYIIGNINEGINIKPEHCDRISCLSCITRRSQSTDECFNCPIASGCSWCSAYNYEYFGTQNKRAIFICCMHKAQCLANVYYQKRMGIDFPNHCPKEWAVEIIGEEEFNKLNNMDVG